MKKALLSILLMGTTSLFAQMEVGSVWMATGTTGSFLENQGFDSTKVHFLASGIFEISYIQGGTPITETSTWQDLSSNQVNITYDPNGNFFGMMCPTSDNSFDYSITSNVMTLTNIQGTCTTAYSVLSNSTWQKVGGASSASVTETNKTHFELFPNPATDKLHIKGINPSEVNELALINTVGGKETVKLFQVASDEVVLNIAHLKRGVYFLGLKNGTYLRFYVN